MVNHCNENNLNTNTESHGHRDYQHEQTAPVPTAIEIIRVSIIIIRSTCTQLPMAVEIIRMIIITMQWGAPVPTAFEIIRIIINIMKLRSTCTHGNWDNQNYHHHNEIKKHLNPRPPMILPLSQSSSASQVHDSLPHLLLYPSCLSLSYLSISLY